ncbi:MAG: peptidase domain-containing ABC transporter [Nevskiales bacterium]
MSESLLERLDFWRESRLKVVLQSEAAECGIACMAMIAGYHGRKLDLNKLRREYPVSLKGSHLQNLIGIAHQLRFTTRALRVELDELAALRPPAILHWNLNHFVVLKGVRGDQVEIHDPAVGQRRLALSTVSKHFTGVALELLPASDFVQKDEQERLRLSQFWKEAVGLKRFLLQLLLMSGVLQVFALLSPFYVQLVVDEAVVRGDQSFLTLLALGFLAVLLLKTAIGWLRSWLVIYLGNLFSLQMQGNLLRHMLRLSLGFFSKRHIGDVVSRFGSMSAIQNLITTGLVEAILDGALLITTLIVLLIYSPNLTLIVVSLLLVYALMRLALYQPLRDLSHENLIAEAEASTQFMETVRGMATVKQFGLELERQNQWQNRFVDVANTGIRIARLSLSFGVVNQLLFGIGGIAVIYLGAKLVMEQAFTVGMLMAFVAYQQQFLSSGGALIDKWMAFKLLDLHLERLGDIALTDPEEESYAPPLPLKLPQAELALREISFRYATSDPLILDGITLDIRGGECVAIIGPSGCGKSTLMRILQGLEQATDGIVKFAGSDIRRLGLANYRGLVASVTQEDRLLSGSMTENITLFDEKPDLDRMVDCAQRCLIHDTIMATPMNYHSLIGDMGDALSAGERQRLMLARALYRQPQVLFLDEATCHMDPELDEHINRMLAELKITRVIVTHRQSPLRYADRVYRLYQGKLEPVLQQPQLLAVS